jgi:hypothetical protein
MVIEHIREGLNVFSNGKKYSLVMLLTNVPYSNFPNWSLIVSAPWLDRVFQKDAILGLLKVFNETLVKDELMRITRINFLNSNDSFVRSINSAFTVEGSSKHLNGVNINGIQIDNAILLESRYLGNPEPHK